MSKINIVKVVGNDTCRLNHGLDLPNNFTMFYLQHVQRRVISDVVTSEKDVTGLALQEIWNKKKT